MRSFKLALGFVLTASAAAAQSYPSPTMQNLTVLDFSTFNKQLHFKGSTNPGLGYAYGPNYNGIWVEGAWTGTNVGGVNGHLFYTTSDNAAITGGDFFNNVTIQHQFGGASLQGGRQSFFVSTTQTDVTSTSNSNRDYVAGAFAVASNTGDGGTGLTTSTAKGQYFALNPVAILNSGATNVLNLTGGEINVEAKTGSSVLVKTGLQIVGHNLDKVQGTDVDAMLGLSGQTGAVGYKTGILFSDFSTAYPIATTGTLMQSVGSTVANGIDISATTVTNSAFKSTGFSVDGSGNLNSNKITTGNVIAAGTYTTAAGNSYSSGGTSCGAFVNGTCGAQWFVFGTSMYFDNYNGDFNFRSGTGYSPVANLTTTGINIPTGSTYKVNNVAGVSCAAGTVNLATLVVTGGIITHC